MKGIVTGWILIIVITMIFMVLILYFLPKLFGRIINVFVEGWRTILCGLACSFCRSLPGYPTINLCAGIGCECG